MPTTAVPNFTDLLTTFQSNVTPAMRQDFAASLGVTADAVRRLGIGFYPAEGSWIFPEYDGNGNVIGLLRRFEDGKKLVWTGGKRGMSYECLGARAGDGSYQQYPGFVRVGEAGVPCPVCGRKNDGCLVSRDDPEDPAAVICVRTPEGSERTLTTGAGYLHRRHPVDAGAGDVLPLSSDPVVVTEGASDALYAMSIGFVAVSRPSADACPKGLADLVRGRSVILVGDRDGSGVGQRGLEAVFQLLKPVCVKLVKCLPPVGSKDLRGWHPTREQFDSHAAASGTSVDDGSVLADYAPLTLVRSWLTQEHTRDGRPLVVSVWDDYYLWDRGLYRKLALSELKGEWYKYFTDRAVKIKDKDGGVKVVSLKPDKSFIANIHDACQGLTHVRLDPEVHEPFLLSAKAPMELGRSIIFKNGILDVPTGILKPMTPDVFVTSTMPFDYDPKARCPVWDVVSLDMFNGNEACQKLLAEWFGYSLIPDNFLQQMMFFYGVPGSGKSTTAGLLQSMLGPQRACAAGTDTFKDLFGKEKLIGKYLAIMSESRDTNRQDIDKLLQTWKAITGGDTISVRRMYRGAVDARLFCRLLYVANEAIPFDDVSQAMAYRMNVLYFPKNYRKCNPDRLIDRKLREEIPGVCNWAIEGLRRLLAQGSFTVPETSKDHLASIAALTNPIGAMLEECCKVHIGSEYAAYKTPVKDLYDVWNAWCDDNRVKTSLSSIAFGMKLQDLNRGIVRRQVMEAGKRFYAYIGLEIKPDAHERYLKR